MNRDPMQLGVAIAMIVFGLLLVLGEFSLRALLPFAGIVLIVFGILILTKAIPGGTAPGIIVLVIGILMLKDVPPFSDALDFLSRVTFTLINVVAGAILLGLGIAKLAAKQ